MGFFFNQTKSSPKPTAQQRQHIPIETMGKMGCKACPLDKLEKDLQHPKMNASGPKHAQFYILGEAPGKDEDEQGEPFVGKSGRLLRRSLNDMEDRVRIHNTIRCRPPSNRTPELAEIECCRGYITKDVEECQPLVVIGAGNIPLQWATGLSGVTKWRGHLIATKIGNHACWYYPILHPSYVLRSQRRYGKSENELVFDYDLDCIFATDLEPPTVYQAPYDKGIHLIDGQSAGDFQRLEDALNAMVGLPLVAIDLETNGLRPYHLKEAFIHLCAIGTFDNTVAFPVDHPLGWNGNTRKKVEQLLLEFLLQSNRKVAHHLGFEMEWLAYRYGKPLLRLTEWEDTMAMAHTLDETPGTHNLDVLCREHFGFFLKAQSPVDLKHHSILDYELRVAMRYNGLDTKWTHLLKTALQPKIDANKNYVHEYERKIALAPTLVLTQLKGIPVNFSVTETMGKKLDEELLVLDKQIFNAPEVKTYEKRFGKFSPSSTDDVLKLMKEVCKRTEVEKRDGDKIVGYTSDEEALNKIPKREVPSASLILERRSVTKLKSTYVDPVLKRKVVGFDDLIHTQYNSMVAVTGRLSSEEPNLQNFPIRKYKYIRALVEAFHGGWIFKADYGQIEARVFAMASQDDALCRAFWTDYDIHGYWAKRVLKDYYPGIIDWLVDEFGIDGADGKLVQSTLRQEMKNRWVFPEFFGSSYKSCAEALHIPELVARDMDAEFWDAFLGVKEWQDDLIKFYQKHLYVETLTGRRRRGLISKNQLINAPIQGTAADICLESMTALSELSTLEEDEDLQANLQIHDDLEFFWDDAVVEAKQDYVVLEMCRHRFPFINVPLLVETELGQSWHKMTKLANFRSDKIFNLRNPY